MHLDFQVQFFLIIYPLKYKKLRRFPFLRTFLDFIFAIVYYLGNFDSCLIFLHLKQIVIFYEDM